MNFVFIKTTPLKKFFVLCKYFVPYGTFKNEDCKFFYRYFAPNGALFIILEIDRANANWLRVGDIYNRNRIVSFQTSPDRDEILVERKLTQHRNKSRRA
jgi:hypothetical protein